MKIFWTLLLTLGLFGLPGGPVAVGESSRPLVGHIMALLAVFEQAEVLPPEGSPEADALIHALIQTQAALTKSTNPATRRWFADALQRSEAGGAKLRAEDGLTARSLEAILPYAATHPPAAQPEVLAGLRELNIGPADFDLLARIYTQARDRLRARGQDLHHLYEVQRHAMPFR